MIKSICDNQLVKAMSELYSLSVPEWALYFLFVISGIVVIFSMGYIYGRYSEFKENSTWRVM